MDAANLVLQATNDITVNAGQIINSTTNGGNGNLTFTAGRSVIINESITLKGSFTASANADPGGGGFNGTQREEGAAVITIADGKTINTAANNDNIVLEIKTGALHTNSTSGDISVEGLNAGAGHISIQNTGLTDGSGIVTTTSDSSITAASVALRVRADVNNEIGSTSNPIKTTVTKLEHKERIETERRKKKIQNISL